MAIVVNTKMELDVSEKKGDELDLILQVLQGTAKLNFAHIKKSKNQLEYTWKNPEQIATDYLTKIFEYLENGKIEYFRKGSPVRQDVPVDIVISVPVVRFCCTDLFIQDIRLIVHVRIGHIAQETRHSEQS